MLVPIYQILFGNLSPRFDVSLWCNNFHNILLRVCLCQNKQNGPKWAHFTQ